MRILNAFFSTACVRLLQRGTYCYSIEMFNFIYLLVLKFFFLGGALLIIGNKIDFADLQ